MDLDLVSAELGRGRRLRGKLQDRLVGIYRYDVGFWRAVVVSLWLANGLAVALSALGMPTGLGTTFDIVASLCLNTIGMAIGSAALSAVIALLGWQVPRLASSSWIYTIVLAYSVLYFSDFGWIGALAYALAYSVLAVVAGGFAGWLADPRRSAGKKIGALAAAVGVAAVIVYAASGLPSGEAAMSDADAADDGASPGVVAQLVSDPSLPGSYGTTSFTYGSGKDRQRDEYGDDALLISDSVDASAYIEDWPWLRTKFWGFDEKALPLNGRVWMPEGEGPFPLVLMVHGNHLMEHYSDAGYDYLGKLLASRGFVAVSVDENFLNYSVWSGIPDADMKTRAWVLLKHIQQLERFSDQEGSIFDGKIDFGNVALIGHSRGGQAVAMAASPDAWFAKEAGLRDESSYRIKAVVALAPTDTVVDGQRAKLKDVSYLTLQGAKDADLVNFYGDDQFARTSFSPASAGFKASLYIEDAIHSQFNTEWGQSDSAMPGALFVRPEGKLAPEDQRKIASAYVSAFMESAMHGKKEFEVLFRDYRAGEAFLPDTGLFGQYQDGRFDRLADFEGSSATALSPFVTATAEGMSEWRHAPALNRQRQAKGNKAVLLGWENDSSYTVHAGQTVVHPSEGSRLAFSIAELGQASPKLAIEVEATDRSGASARLPLSAFQPLLAAPRTTFTWLPWMESALSEGKYKQASEAAFQTIELPLAKFKESNAAFNPAEWTSLTLRFGGAPGQVMIDELGLYP